MASWGLSNPRRHLQVLGAVCALPCLLTFAAIKDERTWYSVALCALISYAGLRTTKALIPIVKAYNLRAGLSGLDINKKGSAAGEKKIPESWGGGCGGVFVVGGGAGCLAGGGGGGGAE